MRVCRTIVPIFAALSLLGPSVNRTEAQQTAASLMPHAAWDCYMPDGIPAPEDGAVILELTIPLDRAADIGRTQYGERRIAVGLEGSVEGPKFSGRVVEGGLDYELTLVNGAIEIEQIIVLQADDGSYILLRNAGTGPDADDVRVVMDFEAPSESEHAWLNSGAYVARRHLDVSARMLTLSVHDVSNVPVNTANRIEIEKPAAVPPQPWDYRVKDASEMQGDEFIVENVTLAPSQTVGISKRGNRNIIPITGGKLSGRISGKVLMGGADYQNLERPATIDARYLWQADDGEIILVRNAGSIASGGLVPIFEARADGPYAYLNANLYLSSPPGMGRGGVSLTFYESED
jgi:hypothetical protein